MAGTNSPTLTIIGNLTGDPELRFTKQDTPVVNLTIAQTPRSYNKGSGEWEDGDTLFIRGTLWNEYAENVAESLTKGMQVFAQGRLVQRNYTDKEGNSRSALELQIDEIGPTLRFARAQVRRIARNQDDDAAPPARQRRAKDEHDDDEPVKPARRQAPVTPADDDDWGDAPAPAPKRAPAKRNQARRPAEPAPVDDQDPYDF